MATDVGIRAKTKHIKVCITEQGEAWEGVVAVHAVGNIASWRELGGHTVEVGDEEKAVMSLVEGISELIDYWEQVFS